jgi:HAE1 family hydrophobic/amphiphilic exporter-1
MSVLTRMSLVNRIVVALLTAVVAVFGVVATTSLNQETLPSLSTPGIIVSATLPGASPEVLEQQVTEPLETALSSVEDVDSVTTETGTGQVGATVLWPFGADEDEMADAVRSSVDTVKADLPEGAEVEVISASIDDTPVVQFAVSSSAAADDEKDDEKQALSTRLDDTLVPELEAVPGVARVDVSGQQEQQVSITFREDDAEKHEVTPATVPDALAAAGTVTPAGESEQDGKSLSVEVGESVESLDEIRATPLTTADGDTVPLSDVADVELVDAKRTSLSRAGGEDAVIVSVVKEQDANVVEVSHGVESALTRAGPTIGDDVEYTTVFDQAPYIEQSIHDLSVEGGLGLLFAVVVILLFLGSFRSTVVAAISIPLSLLIALIGLWVGGFTLNMLTLGALTIAVGRVVDDSIVVIENIRRRQGTSELTVDDIVASVRQVAGAITASTLTTVAVFLPIAFVSGIAGELFSPFAITVTLALLASLLVALTVVPTVSYWTLRHKPKPLKPAKQSALDARYEAWQAKQDQRAQKRQAAAQRRVDGKNAKRAKNGKPLLPDPTLEHRLEPHAEGEASTPVDRLQQVFLPAIRTALRHPGRTVTAAVAILLVTLVTATFLRTDLLGSQGENTLYLTQTLPAGTSLEVSDEAAKKVEAELEQDPDVDTYVSSISAATGTGSNSFTVTLGEGTDPQPVVSRLREDLGALGEDAGEIEVQSATETTSQDVEIKLQGEDVEDLTQASEDLTGSVGDLPGVAAARSDLAADQSVVRVKVDRKKAAEEGFTQADVGQAVALAVDGGPAGTVTLEGTERDVVIAGSHPGASPKEIEKLELPVTEVQTMNAQEKAQDEIDEETDQRTEDAEADLEESNADQLEQARDGVDQAQEQVDEAREQRDALDDPTSATQDPEELLQEQKDAADEQVAAAEDGLDEARQAVDDLEESQEEQRTQSEEEKDLADRQQAVQDLTGDPVTVGEIAEVTKEKVPATITREDGTRQVTIFATPEQDQLNTVSTGVNQLIASEDLPDGVTFVVGGAEEEMTESFTQLGVAMLAAIALVLLVMIGTFKNLREPLILLVSIPFAATGAVLGLVLTDTALGLPALIGLLMLIGIVVTNAIVLMDLINKLRAEGLDLMDAVLQGTRLRLRPILMTAAATVFALVPMALGLTGGGMFISQPLAIVVIGGLTTSTLLTLVLVPVLYVLVEGRRERKERRRAARKKARERAEREATTADDTAEIGPAEA